MTDTPPPDARPDGRAPDALRPIEIRRRFLDTAPGAVLISFGRTRVLCTATVEHRQPPWLGEGDGGWLTAEYAMLPGSTSPRKRRKTGGREKEIQRLIGRALRAALDLQALGELTINIDCDVLQADGGTRTAAITGSYVALVDCLDRLRGDGALQTDPLRQSIAAISVGIVAGRPLLDLCYVEDAAAEVDLNVVMTGDGRYVEIQGTAESEPFGAEPLQQMLDLARAGTSELSELQRRALTEGQAY